MKFILILSILIAVCSANAFEPNWGAEVPVPVGGRGNIYNWNDLDFLKYQTDGKIHAQVYPVTVTGMLPPYQPVRRLLEEDSSNPFRKWLQEIVQVFSGFENFDGLLAYLGLHQYPSVEDRGIYAVPYPNEIRPDTRMGLGLMERNGATGFTFSCAACHSANLFGKTVLGMTNRFPRANEFFVQAKKVMPMINPHLFQSYTGASNAETALLIQSQESLKSVALKQPIALGLDTSLAQVSLSLNRRNKDGYATASDFYAQMPRPDAYLDQKPADSKPAVWWNLKYKNRWLSDGSVLSGNPIFTNLIWNEIGRGTDLRKLERWLAQNDQVIKALTTAVFSLEAPYITDFYPAEKIDLARAQHGEEIFKNTCARCHGNYDKAWSLPEANTLTAAEKLKTINVRYWQQTPVVDVGTDPSRRLGMKSLEQLNDLEISKKNGIVIEAQSGYVPPPLVGIWARWPYLHNNSIPNLCVLLTAGNRRPSIYYSGEAQNPQTDYDFECAGYPLESKMPVAWKTEEHLYDTRNLGMGNDGHDEGIFIRNGKELLSAQEKRDLILFLQTL